MRSGLRVVLATTIALGVLSPPGLSPAGAATTTGCDVFNPDCSGAGTQGDKIRYAYIDPVGWEPQRQPNLPPAAAGVKREVATTPVCGIPVPPDDPAQSDNSCIQAQCEVDGQTGSTRRVWYRQFGGDWELQAQTFCATPPGPVITRAAVAGAAREYIEKRVSPGAPVLKPEVRTLVNFPNIVSTVDAGSVGFDITQPLPGRIDAVPTYDWTFTDGDGATSTATGTGRPYDGTSPRVSGYYLTKPFRFPGTARVALHVTWTAQVTVGGQPPVTLDPIEFDTEAALQVQERRVVLLDPYGSAGTD